MMNKFRLSTTQIILLSFLGTIFLGSILLALPISSANGIPVPYLDALFTATTSTCVTGLVTLPTYSTWSIFGQIVILILIQIGGLGVITIMSGFMLLINRKMGIGDRLLIQDAFNLNTMSGIVRFVKNVLVGTVIVELTGAVLCMFVFVPEFGLKGIWISLFHSISAFCNAGIDIIGENSLCNYATNPLINITTCGLIILSGLGYIVWWDILSVMKKRTPEKKRVFRYLSLHSKIALTATFTLIITGGLLIFLLEYGNPATIQSLSLFDKIQVSVFQSVTTRTAGFASVPQENLTDAASVVSLILMAIGGSPVGTAGGIKTVTVVVLLCSTYSTIVNRSSTTLFGRCIPEDAVRKAVAVVVTFFAICLTSMILMLAACDVPILDVIYETVSATATVGLSRNLTGNLNTFGKLIIIVTMYFGRVGPISLAIALGSKHKKQNIISEPVEEVSIG